MKAIQRLRPQILALIVMTFGGLSSAIAGEEEPWRVLMVGNSYTYYHSLGDKLELLLGQALNQKVEVVTETAGGARFVDHKRRDSVNKRPGPWRFVSLQGQSMMTLRDPESMGNHLDALAKQIRHLGAKPVLFMTWPRREQPEDGKTIAAVYRDFAARHDALVAPVGEAFMLALELAPSLHLQLYDDDGSHPSRVGAWLAALVFCEVLAGVDVTKLGPPQSLDPRVFHALADLAHRSTAGKQGREDSHAATSESETLKP